MKQIRKALMVLSVTFCALVLCGCAAFGAPASTEQLLARYVANEDVGNFAATIDTSMNVSALGVRASVPITVSLQAANNKAHGTAEVDLSSLDTRNYTLEFYGELLDDVLNCYIGYPGSERTAWRFWQVKMTSKVDLTTLVELLSSSELTIIAKDADPEVSYELWVPTSEVLNTAFNVTADSAEVAGMDEQDMIDAVGDGKVRVGFTKDYLMHSLETGVTCALRSAATNNVEVRVGIEIAATLSDYGSVDPEEVAIPLAVRQGAIPTDKPIDVIEVIGPDSPLAGAVGS